MTVADAAQAAADLRDGHAPAERTEARHPLLRGLLRDRTARIGLFLVVGFALLALLGPALAPRPPNEVSIIDKFAPPSHQFPLGTDHLGRDVFSRLLHGARVSLVSTAVVALGVSLLGTGMGMLAGYIGGVVDTLISRIVDALLVFPPFLLALAMTGVFGASLHNVMLAIVATWWTSYARVVRASVLAERSKPYVEAAEASGASALRVLGRHLAANVMGPVVILTTLDLGAILLGISSLSFLGLGVKPPTAEWGSMLAEGKTYLSPAPHIMFFPGAAIFLAVLGFNLLGDGLRDVLDPRTERPLRVRAQRGV